MSLEDKKALFESPVALFLLSRGDSATRLWNPQNIFEEKQNDTAGILFHDNKFFEVIDVKTRNMAKSAMAPNIISAYKVAQICTFIIGNEE
ncbi:HincII family type II restriction endonuclease [Prevotella nigrescens]|uniref:HincII family type II restriction endonuclease n=1 Tax=Prevotella nigrescens TaxID=28133 RepID=UPI002880AB2F|nr:HincII family type II restriction endonuclease [Prevotella nigrescens]